MGWPSYRPRPLRQLVKIPRWCNGDSERGRSGCQCFDSNAGRSRPSGPSVAAMIAAAAAAPPAAATSDEEQDGFIRIERRRSSNPKRPPSRLNLAAKDISRPLSVETTVNSLTSSPTHQLLMTHSASVLTASDLEAAVVDGSGRVKVTFHNELYSNFFILLD